MKKLKFLLISILIFSFRLHAQDRVIFSDTIGNKFKVEITEDLGRSIVLKISGANLGRVKSFQMFEPQRFVVDLEYQGTPITHKSTIHSSPLIQRIRVGTDKGRIRFVIDFNTQNKMKVAISSNEDMFTATLTLIELFIKTEANNSEKNLVNLSPVKTPTQILIPSATFTPLPKIIPTLLASPTPTPTVTHTVISTVVAITTSAPLATITPESVIEIDSNSQLEEGVINEEEEEEIIKLNSNSGSALTSLGFKYIDDADKVPGIRVSFSSFTNYSLIRKSRDVYELIIPDSYLLDQNLNVPYFAPQDFESFISLKAQELDGNVVLTLLVEDGVRLITFPDGNDLYIREME
jgi:hypothetical protein